MKAKKRLSRNPTATESQGVYGAALAFKTLLYLDLIFFFSQIEQWIKQTQENTLFVILFSCD